MVSGKILKGFLTQIDFWEVCQRPLSSATFLSLCYLYTFVLLGLWRCAEVDSMWRDGSCESQAATGDDWTTTRSGADVAYSVSYHIGTVASTSTPPSTHMHAHTANAACHCPGNDTAHCKTFFHVSNVPPATLNGILSLWASQWFIVWHKWHLLARYYHSYMESRILWC